MSPGWQSKILHNASSVEKRIALAFPFLSIDKFAGVISIFSAIFFALIIRIIQNIFQQAIRMKDELDLTI